MTTLWLSQFLPYDMEEVIIKKIYTHHVLDEMSNRVRRNTHPPQALRNFIVVLDGRIRTILAKRVSNEDILFCKTLLRLRNVREQWQTKLDLQM
jgi:hypothetical protein